LLFVEASRLETERERRYAPFAPHKLSWTGEIILNACIYFSGESGDMADTS